MSNPVFAFEVWLVGQPDWKQTINARTRGKAKSQYFRDVSESWDIEYPDVYCRKIGDPVTSEQFLRNAKYRGMPDLECGQRVQVGSSSGVIVGHNSSANFQVLFDDDDAQYPGQTLAVHPNDLSNSAVVREGGAV